MASTSRIKQLLLLLPVVVLVSLTITSTSSCSSSDGGGRNELFVHTIETWKGSMNNNNVLYPTKSTGTTIGISGTDGKMYLHTGTLLPPPTSSILTSTRRLDEEEEDTFSPSQSSSPTMTNTRSPVTSYGRIVYSPTCIATFTTTMIIIIATLLLV